MNSLQRCLLHAALAASGLSLPAAGRALDPGAGDARGPASPVDFDRDVRPILAENCYACHGPDAAARKAGLRLDLEQGARAALRSGGHAIVPGDGEASELVARIRAEDPSDRMPPPKSKKVLTSEQVALLTRWIEEGAPWAEHWAFRAPLRPAVPPVPPGPREHATFGENPIDAFVLRRMQEHGLAPSPEAAPATWLRRVSFDLTGLPPTPEELDRFLADVEREARANGDGAVDAAYGRVVERLLGSPRYGERMAADWLDAARYADTNGYHYDNQREMWPWRDWVVQAFNANLPYDRFTIEQLAGDLLPDATQAQRVATGFNRNHPINWEGGIVPEEYLAEYVVDRVATTSTVWMGLTVACARCHDHKFDPLAQREFYELYDFFHQVPENGLDGLQGNAPPTVPVMTAAQQADHRRLEQALALPAQALAADVPEPAAFEAWQRTSAARNAARWQVLGPVEARAEHGAVLVREPDDSLFAEGPHAASEVYVVTGRTDATDLALLRLEALADERLPHGGPGRAFHANSVLSGVTLEIAPAAPAGEPDWSPVRFDFAHADHSQPGFHVARAIDGERGTGWALKGAPYGETRTAVFVAARPFGFAGGTLVRATLRFESDYEQHALGRFRLALGADEDPGWRPSALGEWSASLDGEPVELGPPAGLQALDGRGTHVLTRTLDAPSARELVLALGSSGAHTLRFDGALVHERHARRDAAEGQDEVLLAVAPGRHELALELRHPDGPGAFALERLRDEGPQVALRAAWLLTLEPGAVTDDARGAERRAALREAYLGETRPGRSAARAELARLRAELATLLSGVPTTMVMDRLAERRATHVLERGRYDRLGERVTAGVPAALPPLARTEPGPPDRLDLARWLVDPGHPLTARVAVNRLWAQCFGRGIVATPDDFGTQGARPTHPELLDWLAVELVETGWDLQHVLRLLVTSRTYRQAGDGAATARAADPDNLWLARAPRLRLPAEAVRDAALFASGLLVERVGGPPVKPYQPPGLWEEVGSDFDAFTANSYRQGSGDDLYRRSLYTFRKRSVPPPGMLAFDAPTREFCSVLRSRTNTPLQALALWNDVTYVEASRALAERVLREAVADAARVELAFALVLSRAPTPHERERVLALVRGERDELRRDPARADALLGVGEAPRDERLDPVEHAAWTLAASVLFNLDEAITRG